MCVINYAYLYAVFMPNVEMEEDKKLDGKHAIEEAMSTYSLRSVRCIWLI
jgi:hypothetical protein